MIVMQYTIRFRIPCAYNGYSFSSTYEMFKARPYPSTQEGSKDGHPELRLYYDAPCVESPDGISHSLTRKTPDNEALPG